MDTREHLQYMMDTPRHWADILRLTDDISGETGLLWRQEVLMRLWAMPDDGEEWDVLWTTGFVMTLAELMFAEDFCGHTQTQLTAAEGLSGTAVVSCPP